MVQGFRVRGQIGEGRGSFGWVQGTTPPPVSFSGHCVVCINSSVTAWAWRVQQESAVAWGKLSRVASFPALPAPVFAGGVWSRYFWRDTVWDGGRGLGQKASFGPWGWMMTSGPLYPCRWCCVSPLTTSISPGHGVSNAGALSVHRLCCWAGRCWFLDRAGNRQLLGKP